MSFFRFARHTWTLFRKDVSIVVFRQWAPTFLRALALPIAYMFFIAYCRNFFLPPSEYGIGSPNPIRDLFTEVFNSPTDLGGRNRVVFVDSGFSGGDIEDLISLLADPLRDSGADVRIVSDEDEIFDICPSSLTGLSRCFGAATFHASPTEGPGDVWSYTARMDAGLGASVYVQQDDNDAQKFVLPFIHAIDAGIATLSGSTDFPPARDMAEYPFTYETRQERDDDIHEFFMRALTNYLAVSLFIGMCGITYHLPGHFASERELGLSSLIDAMLYAKHRVHAMLVRLVSVYLSFSAIYMPAWIAMGVIVSQLIFTHTDASIVVFFHILTGFALTGYSISVASCFRKSQLSGTTALLLGLVLAIMAQFMPWNDSAHGLLGALFPSFAYTSFMIQLARYEVRLRGINLNANLPYSSSGFTGYLYFIFMAIHIMLHPILAAIVQWLSYGTSLRAHGDLGSDSSDVGLKILNVSKTFRPFSWHSVFRPKDASIKAVDNLSLSLAHGHIVALLGANGSGKSTTLANVAGTQNPTHGRIERDRSTGLGFCPQQNVLWDQLSVMEHIKIFSALKARSKPESKAQIKELVAACDLEGKVGAKSKALSGGQKRKLQLAMAFVGGSQVCCVDEVTSGLDPLSRRKIWHILLSERGRRTLLLTTHALDEADALADQVAIMSKGKLIVQGSAPELKHRYGGGYRILSSETQPQSMREAQCIENANGQLVYTAASSAEACEIAKRLRRDGVKELYLAGPSIEDVFLEVSQEFRDEISESPNTASSQSSDKESPAYQQSETPLPTKALNIASGRGTSLFRQTWILFRKRLLILGRNWLPYLCAVVIPIATGGLTTMFLSGFERLLCSRGELANNPRVLSLLTLEAFWGILVPVGPPTAFQPTSLPADYLQFVDRLRVQNTFGEFNNYIADNFRDVVPGGLYLDYNGEAAGVIPAPLLAYRINGNLGYSALAKTVMDSYLMNTTIDADFSTFALPFIGSTGDSLQLVIYTGLAMSAYIGFFALYPTFERRSNIRALHYSNGLRPAPLWLAYGLFDAFFVALVAIITTSIFTSMADVWFAPSYLGVVFFLFGIASIYLAYIISLFATTQLAAFAFVAGGQAIFLLIYFLLYLVLLTFADAESLQTNLNTLQYTLGLISPSGNLLRVLLVSLNQSQVLCRGRSIVSYPGDFDAYGCPILYLTLQAICFYIFLVWHDNGKPFPLLSIFQRNKELATHDDESAIKSIPFDVRDETARVQNSDDKLKVLHLEKIFNRYKAVDDVTFGVGAGEKLALLGPNGAGKTTTLSLIRGDLRPSSRISDVLISGLSIRKDQLAARRLLGVCPQFNTMDLMTVHEHLAFYARARGVPDIHSNVAKVMEAVGLTPYKKRMTGKLSGGNQRKLSLATAIIGNPTVLLLDEPSTGMDAVAMRVMWKAVRAICAGRAIIITTHSMEEASTLSDRTAIVDQRLLTIDTTSELTKRHGAGFYHVHIVLANGPASTPEEMQKVRDWVARSFQGATMHDRLFPDSRGQLRFQITTTANQVPILPSNKPSSSSAESASADNELEKSGTDTDSIGIALTTTDNDPVKTAASDQLITMLDTLESAKERLGIGYYTIGQATLEDVFLDVISRNRAL
ncbi:MAG: hypothetical protein Q9176_007899 [Flavoplaca citrina]